jgi:hypothetical protein
MLLMNSEPFMFKWYQICLGVSICKNYMKIMLDICSESEHTWPMKPIEDDLDEDGEEVEG